MKKHRVLAVHSVRQVAIIGENKLILTLAYLCRASVILFAMSPALAAVNASVFVEQTQPLLGGFMDARFI